MAISKHQAHVDSVLTVQAQLAAAAAARGVHAAPLPPAAPSAPARSRLPPPDLSLRLRLNVGGQRFEVSQHVMLQDPTSLLAALCAVHNDAAGTPMPTLDDFTGENGQGLSAADMGTPHMLAITAALAATSLRPRIPPPSPDGSYFFERDWCVPAQSPLAAAHAAVAALTLPPCSLPCRVMFRHLLNFLRDGRLPSRTSLLRDLSVALCPARETTAYSPLTPCACVFWQVPRSHFLRRALTAAGGGGRVRARQALWPILAPSDSLVLPPLCVASESPVALLP